MSGTFTAGGLITGLNTEEIISQLIQLERQPVLRMQSRISLLEQQRGAINQVRTQLQTLRNRAQDFRLNTVFGQFRATSSEESVLAATLTGANPISGTYTIQVLQLASATVARSSGVLGAAIDRTFLSPAAGYGLNSPQANSPSTARLSQSTRLPRALTIFWR